MIVLITDFGMSGPYLAQLEAAVLSYAANARILSLFADAPVHNPKRTAYLIPAYATHFPAGTIFLCVVDPGVGTAADPPVAVKAGESWYVGPHNGLFDVVLARAEDPKIWQLLYEPDAVSMTFHGRDVYAPAAARLERGERPEMTPLALPDLSGVSSELDEIVYIDHFGNAMTGRRAGSIADGSTLTVRGHALTRRLTFGAAQAGEAFWYENSNGLIEIAVNRGRASEVLGLKLGDRVGIS